MNVQFSRPSVREMFFRLYTRPLHPELFECLASRHVQHLGCSLTVQIIPSGHVISWQAGGLFLTEVAAAEEQPLPRRGSRIRHRLLGAHSRSIPTVGKISYRMCSQLEWVSPEAFMRLHEEFEADGAKRGLLYRHAPAENHALSPLGFVTIEAWRHTLSINAFHTFPQEGAIVKTQSLIERI